MNKLRKLSNFGIRDWAKLLPKAVHAYNISFCRAIGMTPNELFGLELCNYETLKSSGYTKLPENKQFENTTTAVLLADTYYNEYGKDCEKVKSINVGDWVYYYHPEIHTSKLESRWGIKYKVVDVMFKSYKLLSPTGKLIIANQNCVITLNGRGVLGF